MSQLHAAFFRSRVQQGAAGVVLSGREAGRIVIIHPPRLALGGITPGRWLSPDW